MFTLAREAWSEAAAADVAAIVPSCPMPPGFYRDEVERRGSSLVGVYREGVRIGSAIIRPEGDEAVIVAGSGRAPGRDLVAAILPAIERECAAAGFAAIRFHTRRPGLVRKAERAGYRVQETVMRKGL